MISRTREFWTRLNHFQKFSMTSLFFMVVCTVFFGWFAFKIILKGEEELTVNFLRHQVIRHFSTEFFQQPQLLDNFGKQLLEEMPPEDTFGLTIYGPKGRIIWSDEAKLVGRMPPVNPYLTRALGGQVTSVINPHHGPEYIHKSGTFGYVIETYVPIAERQKVVGVVEVHRYLKGFPYFLRMSGWVPWITFLVGGGLLYLTLIGVTRRISNHQQALEKELHLSAERIESERSKLERIVNAMEAGLLLVDPTGHIGWANRKATSWFGTEESLIGASVRDTICRESCEVCPFKSPKSPVFPIQCEHRIAQPGGGERFFQILTTRDPNPGLGEAVGYFLQLILDVTLQSEMDAKLRQADKIALIGQLAAGVAHQINNPVSILLTTITYHLAQKNEDPEYVKGDLEMMERQCRKIDYSVKSLLSFARVSEQKKTPVDYQEIIHEALLLTKPSIERNRIQLETLLPDEPCIVVADPKDLLQVVLNLINNGTDAMPDGGKMNIVLSVATEDREKIIKLTITDTGGGIPPEILTRIFEPFFTTKEIGGGTGLGLAVSKRIVESAGGTINAENGQVNGSLFQVRLPYCGVVYGD